MSRQQSLQALEDVTGISRRTVQIVLRLAKLLGRDDRTVRRWATGDNEIPAEVAEWLAVLADCLAQNPLPRARFNITLEEQS